MTFGQRIKALREKRDLSREDFAKILGVSYWTLSKYETNERKPDYATLTKIAYFFGVSTDFLLGITENNDYHYPITLKEVINRISNDHLLDMSKCQQLINKAESLFPLDTPYMIFRNNTLLDKDAFIKKSGLKQLGVNTIEDLDSTFDTIFFEDNPHLKPEILLRKYHLQLIEALTGDKLGDWVQLIEKANLFNISPQELMPILEIINQSRGENLNERMTKDDS